MTTGLRPVIAIREISQGLKLELECRAAPDGSPPVYVECGICPTTESFRCSARLILASPGYPARFPSDARFAAQRRFVASMMR
jgi:hypothetical protein